MILLWKALHSSDWGLPSHCLLNPLQVGLCPHHPPYVQRQRKRRRRRRVGQKLRNTG